MATGIFTGFSEFGRPLADFLELHPQARGAVLSDAEGDAVDFAYREGQLSALDVQILGAQVDRAASRIEVWSAARGYGACEILIEASHGRMCCAFLEGAYVLAVLLEAASGDPEAHTAAAEAVLASFRELRGAIEVLLRA